MSSKANLASFHAACEFLSAQHNDLQRPAIALEPVIADCLAALQENGAMLARMSGSGATCFGIFTNEANAARAAGGDKAQISAMVCEGRFMSRRMTTAGKIGVGVGFGGIVRRCPP